MLDGKRFLPETGTPIRNTACIRRPFALAEPVPLTFASLTAKSFTRVRKSLCTIDDLVVIVRIAGISSLHSLVLIGRATFHLTTWMRENARMPSRTLAVLGLILAAHVAIAAERRIDVKVVVVAMLERGADIGDQPGEYQDWVEREKLDRVYPLPQGYHDLRMNRKGVLGLLTGIGTAKAAASVMALGLDPRFDLTKAYWVVAGIAGVDPADASIGSAAWAEWVVDGDLAHEIDAREIPSDWKTGFVPLRKTKPYEGPRTVPNEGESYRLNPALVDWAYQKTKDVKLEDTEAMRKNREQYDSPNARRPPFV